MPKKTLGDVKQLNEIC